MCFLKNISRENDADLFNALLKDDPVSIEETILENTGGIVRSQKQAEFAEEQKLLVKLFSEIEKNNNFISQVQKVFAADKQMLTECERKNEMFKKYSKQSEAIAENANHPDPDLDGEKEISKPYSPLIEKLFGSRSYKYSIRLVNNFPRTLYKERNFNLSVSLVDRKNKAIRNCNIIYLCLAMCTETGEWVHENHSGEQFMKGKTEVELYKGQGSFFKLYARDVSRRFDHGRINIVVYPKPSTIIYSNFGSYETIINYQQIRPLLIEGISIKAKRKTL